MLALPSGADIPVVTAVLRALEKECGLILEGKEYIPERPVTVAYQKVTLEEVIESLIRLTGLPSTMLAVASSGALKLAVLATGTPLAESMSMINGGRHGCADSGVHLLSYLGYYQLACACRLHHKQQQQGY